MATKGIPKNSKPISFGAEIHAQLAGFCVIAWKRRDNPPGSQYLYIFPSVRGYHSAYDNKTLGKIEPFKKRDTIEVWPAEDANEMKLLCYEMIHRHQPKYNSTEQSRSRETMKCRTCGEEFKQTRFWQKDCPKCKA